MKKTIILSIVTVISSLSLSQGATKFPNQVEEPGLRVLPNFQTRDPGAIVQPRRTEDHEPTVLPMADNSPADVIGSGGQPTPAREPNASNF